MLEQLSDEEGNIISTSSISENSSGRESESDNDGCHYSETYSDSGSIKSNDYIQEVKGGVLNSDSLEDFVTKGTTVSRYDYDDRYNKRQ